MRRGSFQIPLNWIYVIIVGTLVIVLFTRIGFVAIDTGERMNAEEITRYFNSVIEGFAETASQMGVAELDRIEFAILIDESGASRVGYGGQTNLLKGYVFSEPTLRGRISYWSYPFATGYTSSNLLFLSDGSVQYVFRYHDSDEDFREHLERELPTRYRDFFMIEFREEPSVTQQENPRFICLNASALPNDPCDIIVQSAQDDHGEHLYDFGTIIFDPNGAGVEYPYYNLGMVFAAAFAADNRSYHYGMLRPIERHEVLRKVLQNKTRELQEISDPPCSTIYEDIDERFDTFEIVFEPGSIASAQDIMNAIEDNVADNARLFRDGCARVY